MIIAFNNMERDGKESIINMIAMGLTLRTMKKARVLMLDSGFGSHILEEAIAGRQESVIREPFAYMEGEGLDYLMKKSSNRMLSEKTTEDGVIYVKDNLGYIPGAVKKHRIMYEYEFGRECRNILRELDKIADYVLVDCSNIAEYVRWKIQETADLIIVNVAQCAVDLEQYFSYYSSFWKKSAYCIGNYIGEEPYNLKNIQRLYRIEDRRIGIVPYNVEFRASLRKGKAVSFFENYHIRGKSAGNREFFHELERILDMVTEWEEEYGCVRK